MTGDGRGEAVLLYHGRSTHHPGRYARGPGFLDWANQPDPFRTYAGAPVVELPLAGEGLPASWGDLHRPGAVSPRPLDRASFGAFLELALGITAWKEHGGARWALRANPSSGNLHPTEGYVLVGAADGISPGLHHYLSRDHVLEQRWAPTATATLARLSSRGAFALGLASIQWREAWKYGERAFRYCQHDVGHALGAIRNAAAVLGWSARLLEAPGDDDVSALLGLDRRSDFAAVDPADCEHPDALVVVTSGAAIDQAARRVEGALELLREALGGGRWAGTPNALSPDHVEWPAIVDVTTATAKPRTPSRNPPPPHADAPPPATPSVERPGDARLAVRLIRARRSAVAMDGATGLTASAFFAMLDRLIPRLGVPPWDVLPWAPRVHPVLFVHRVDGVAPGLYVLERSPDAHAALREALRPSFAWERPAGCPEGLRLFRLEEGDARPLARSASCHQEIASDSAFAVAMLADLGPALDEGPWWYRRLHWEAGLLGQVLYLEAEAAGVRATGIGCFFDDVVHEAVGLADGRFRDLYHFTVGGAVEDRRLTTRSGYGDAVTRRA
jgi:SagB-type dehydrogenase family enzyme